MQTQTLHTAPLLPHAQGPHSSSTTALGDRPMAYTTYRPHLPRGAQQPQIQPRSDLPFDAPKRKNVLRKSSKSSSSTTVTTIASFTSSNSSSNHNNFSVTPFPICNEHNSPPPIEPGCDPLLDRLRYDLSYPPQQKPLPSPPAVALPEVPFNQFGTDNNTLDVHEIQASWSDSGHLTRQNTFSALFISPSSSSSSSETGHYDAVYHHPRSHAAHPSSHVHAHQQSHPMPLSYHLPSRRMLTDRPRSTVQLNSDLESQVSHSHSIDSNLTRKSSSSWWKRPLGLLGDKKNKEDSQYHLSRATSLSVSAEPRPQARRIRNENGTIALSSATSESGHLPMSSAAKNLGGDFSSRAQRKLRKRPPSAWNPNNAISQTDIPFRPVQPQSAAHRTSVNLPPVNQRVNQRRRDTNSVTPFPVHSSSSSFDHSRNPDVLRYRHTVYDDTGRRGYEYEYMSSGPSSHVNTHSHYQQFHNRTFGATHNAHLPLHPDLAAQYMPIPAFNAPVDFPIQNDRETLSPVNALPPLPSVSPLHIQIPCSPTPPPNSTLSEFARCKSEPDLTIKASNDRSRMLTSTSTSNFTSNVNGTRSEAMVQSPIDISSPSVCSSSGEERTPPQVLSPVSSSETRPSFLRSPSNRRWTLAVSETPENELVEELERLRRIGWALGFQGELVKVKGEEEAIRDGDLDAEVVTETNGDISGRRQVSNPSSSSGGGIPSNVKWRKEEMEEWLNARKALLVCREIVRTEKTYREGLETLQRGGTLDSPPPLLLQYLPALISASRAFSTRLAEDPSAWGVSTAFMNCEEILEAAFVAWSGVVGEFFGKSNGRRNNNGKHDNNTRRLGLGLGQPPHNNKGQRTGRRISLGFDRIPLVQSSAAAAQSSGLKNGKKNSQSESATTRLHRNATTSFSNLQAALWRRSTPSLAFSSSGQSDVNGAADIDTPETNGGNTKPFDGGGGALSSSSSSSQDMCFTPPPAPISRKSRYFSRKFGSSSGNDTIGKNTKSGNGGGGGSVKVPSVQDLAIQPVQRVVRYVLLYKDLFNSTPETSPSRALVERALEGASRIAQRCNRAQDNAAFLL